MFPLPEFDRPALIDADQNVTITYKELGSLIKKISALEIVGKKLIFIFNNNSISDVVSYIAALNSGHTVCLLDTKTSSLFKESLINIYRPDYIFDSQIINCDGYQEISSPWKNLFVLKSTVSSTLLHPQLSLLLATSGTTGNPKLVRLSSKNILENAKSINEYLKISSEETAIASLPFHYSYGLSILHTHLLAHACIVLTQLSVAQLQFWDVVNRYSVTSMAGVPITYKILERIGFAQFQLQTLRTLTQAGGHLDSQLVKYFADLMKKRSGNFFVMYGQTEATARIAYLPPKYLPEKAEAIGIPIPGGLLRIEENELIYEGPNVMLGYATGSDDLKKDNELHGVLHTGDLGYQDTDGLFYITGRIKRISKIYGLRLNLDDLEKSLSKFGLVAITSDDLNIKITFENISSQKAEEAIKFLSKLYQLHESAFTYKIVSMIPRTSSGKINYHVL